MPRPFKDGLDYWQLDTDAFADGKVVHLKMLTGAEGLLCWIVLLSELYRVGCCFKWRTFQDKISVCERSGLSLERVDVCVQAMIESELFSQDIFTTTGILTSYGIQKRFFSAASRRKKTFQIPQGILLLKPSDFGCTVAIEKEIERVDIDNERERRASVAETPLIATLTPINTAITLVNVSNNLNQPWRVLSIKTLDDLTRNAIEIKYAQQGLAKHYLEPAIDDIIRHYNANPHKWDNGRNLINDLCASWLITKLLDLQTARGKNQDRISRPQPQFKEDSTTRRREPSEVERLEAKRLLAERFPEKKQSS